MADVEKIAADLRAGLEGVTPGPWMVYDGCSWRRIGTAHGRRDDCAVLAPTKASDGHPDLTCSRGNDRDANLEHIARCDPDTIRALLDELSRLRDALKPFAAWAEKLEREFSDHDDTVIAAGIHGAFVTFGDLRRARALSTQVEERE